MGTTPGGLPFPESTGPVRIGASDIEGLARAVETKYGPKRKFYLDAAVNTDVNGLFDLAVPTTANIIGCVVYERNTNPDPNGPLIDIKTYQIDQANHRLRCRAYIINPFGVVSSGAVNVSAIVWGD